MDLQLRYLLQVVFDKLVLKDQSLLLIPRSRDNLSLRIDQLSISGRAYLWVYDDATLPTPAEPMRYAKDPKSEGAHGRNGDQGVPGPAPRPPFVLSLTIGVSGGDQFVVLAQGQGGSSGGRGGNGQDGADTNSDLCLVGRRQGGNGGNAGHGGKGGRGADGATVRIQYSGVTAQEIANPHYDGDLSLWLAKALSDRQFVAKSIEKPERQGNGLNILQALQGSFASSEERRKVMAEIPMQPLPIPSDIPLPLMPMEVAVPPITLKGGLTILNGGGPGGPGGQNGNPGNGGAGVKCLFSHDLDPGWPGKPDFTAAPIGDRGADGKIELMKLD